MFGEWATVYDGLVAIAGVGAKVVVPASTTTIRTARSARRCRWCSPGKPRRLLDIGGNTGKWATPCMQHDPDVEVTLMDLPGQLRNAEQNLREAGLLARARFHEADLLDERSPIPTEFDAIWMSQFLDCFSEAEIVSILRRCVAAAGPEPGSASSRRSGTVSASRPPASACR